MCTQYYIILEFLQQTLLRLMLTSLTILVYFIEGKRMVLKIAIRDLLL